MGDRLRVVIGHEIAGPIRHTTEPRTVHPSETEIAIRLQMLIRNIWTDLDDTVQGVFSEQPLILVEIHPTEGISEGATETENLVCMVTAVREVASQIRNEFARFVNDDSFLESRTITYPANLLPEPDEAPLATMVVQPEEFAASRAFRQFRDETTLEMMNVGAAVSRWLWWRSSGLGNFPLSEISLFWSVDGITWIRIPKDMTQQRERSHHWKVDEDARADFGRVGAFVLDASSAWDLHREAWSQKELRPRSSVLLGVAAAEIGFKEWIGRMVPNAAWLLETGPSPKLADMVADYMPMLVAENLGLEFARPISKSKTVKEIIRRVNDRNTIAHSPRSSRRYKNADKILDPSNVPQRGEFLMCVADFLWLLDYLWLLHENRYATWAWLRIRPASRGFYEFRS